MRATVIVTAHNYKHYLVRLFESMDYYKPGADYDLFVADNSSDDGTPEFLAQHFVVRENFKRLQLNRHNLWDHAVYNSWIPTILTDWVLFLNADVRIKANGWLAKPIAELRENPELGLVGHYAGHCEDIKMDFCPPELEWVRRIYVERVGQEFDHLGHIHQSIFLARRDLFDKVGLFYMRRTLTDRVDNIASEMEFSVRLRRMGYRLGESKSIGECFYHFGQKFPMTTYSEILEREKSLKLPEMT